MIDIRPDTSRAARAVGQIVKQLPFATSVAINETAKDFQGIKRKELKASFTVRRAQWVDRNVKIRKFAKKRDLVAEVAIEAPGDASRSDILSKFEEGGTKRPRKGKALAVPIAARSNKKRVVPKRLRISELNLRPVSSISTRKTRIIGDHRSFIAGRYILQRTGRAAKGVGKDPKVRVLYSFKKSVPISADLNFFITAKRVIAKEWAKNFTSAFGRALRTAR